MDAGSMDAAATENRVVQRASLGGQIADALRQDILFGRLKAGTRLSQRELCEQFGTSRMPVRDALRALLHEGLLTLDSGQHTLVAPLSKSDLLDSFIIEGTLTGLAAKRATDLCSAGDLEELNSLQRQMVSAAKMPANAAPASMAGLNWTFHRKINRMADSRKLLAALRVVSIDMPRDFLERLPEYQPLAIDEHAQILSAMRAKDGSRAGDLMTKHVISSGKALIDYLEAQGALIPSGGLEVVLGS
jgi:DNA-binding GntR family transcriptional regulator